MNIDLLRKQQLLILEDEPATCQLMEAFFDGVCPVDIVRTPEEVFARIEKKSYDLAIFDIWLDHLTLDGIDVLRRARATGEYENLPVLAATGRAMPGDREMLLAAGFDGYLAKPFTRKELFQSIQQLLGRIAADINLNGASSPNGCAFR